METVKGRTITIFGKITRNKIHEFLRSKQVIYFVAFGHFLVVGSSLTIMICKLGLV